MIIWFAFPLGPICLIRVTAQVRGVDHRSQQSPSFFPWGLMQKDLHLDNIISLYLKLRHFSSFQKPLFFKLLKCFETSIEDRTDSAEAKCPWEKTISRDHLLGLQDTYRELGILVVLCLVLNSRKLKLWIVDWDKSSHHEEGVFDIRDRGHSAPPTSDDTADVDAEKECDYGRQRRRSFPPFFVLGLRPLPATLNVFKLLVFCLKPAQRCTHTGVESLTFCLVPDVRRAQESHVVLVVELQSVIAEEEEERNPKHPTDGEVVGSQLAPKTPRQEGPAPTKRALGTLLLLCQDVSNPEIEVSVQNKEISGGNRYRAGSKFAQRKWWGTL